MSALFRVYFGMLPVRARIDVYSGCTAGDCLCNSRNGEWRPGCWCMCHFQQMDQLHGVGQWTVEDYDVQCEHGLPAHRHPVNNTKAPM